MQQLKVSLPWVDPVVKEDYGQVLGQRLTNIWNKGASAPRFYPVAVADRYGSNNSICS